VCSIKVSISSSNDEDALLVAMAATDRDKARKAHRPVESELSTVLEDAPRSMT